MRVPIPQVQDRSLVTRRLLVRAHDVIFVKGILEASEGLACMFAERGGELLLVAPRSREGELDELVRDLRDEVGAIVSP